MLTSLGAGLAATISLAQVKRLRLANIFERYALIDEERYLCLPKV